MDQKFLYWDEYPDKKAGKKQGTKMAKKKKRRMTEDVYSYIDNPQEAILYMEGYTAPIRTAKVKRVQKLYEDFEKLSQIEKQNFMNLIYNKKPF